MQSPTTPSLPQLPALAAGLLTGLVVACHSSPNSTPAPQPQGESGYDAVAARALSVKVNAAGYKEATFRDGVVMIYVPAGDFTMGNDALTPEVCKNTYPASPAHQVHLSGYWIAKTPTTIGQFSAFIKATGYTTDPERAEYEGPWVYDFAEQGFRSKKGYRWDNAFKDVLARYPELSINEQHPVNAISWYDAIAYTNWLSKETGLRFTLPTEAEWEYAARGTDGRPYPWGSQTPDGTRANYADETFDKYFPNTGQSIVHHGVNDGFAITSPVGSFPAGASPVGALDMAGNLTEWIYDGEYEYTAAAATDPVHPLAKNIRMQKAGFWAGSAGRAGVTPDELENGHNIRSESRQGDDPHSADDHLGFRIAISATPRP